MRKVKFRCFVAGCMLVFAAAPAAGLGDPEPAWQRVEERDGVTVWKGAADDGSRIARATATVDAPLCDVLAIVRDVDGLCDWMADCVETRELARESAFVNELYLRIEGEGWIGVADRDVVVATHTRRGDDGIEVMFATLPRPDVTFADGVVRMPRLEGSYRLAPAEGGRTEVDYRFSADLGGDVPGWIAERTVTGLPRRTLEGLRATAPQRRGSFAAMIAAWPKLDGEVVCAAAGESRSASDD